MTVTPDPELTCQHPRHYLMLWFWLGWNPDREGGRWETCPIPRAITGAITDYDQGHNPDT
jgi:hypothetical protein